MTTCHDHLAFCLFGCKEDMTNSHIFMCPNPDNSQLEKLQKGNIQVQFFVKKEE